jgi:hypothetical protein
MIEDFFPFVICSLSCEYLCEFSKKFKMALMVYSGAWGNLIHEKNQKSKISHCPFKGSENGLFEAIFWESSLSNSLTML